MMASNQIITKRRLLAPEVVQTSAMDCGPASLKCLLEGFGIPVSYGRLREACQTDVDGTSIDTIEEVAVQLGLQAEQVMVPDDHLLLAEAESLPAVVVTRLPNGFTHFVVLWRRHGGFVQLMDPGTGRRWPTREEFLKQLYIHTTEVPAADWREWAGTGNFLGPLRRRLSNLGLSKKEVAHFVSDALEDEGWRSLARLDAATRMTDSIVRAGGIRKRQAAVVLSSFIEEAGSSSSSETEIIPENYWLARSAPNDSDGNEQLKMKGVVLIHVNGRRTADQSPQDESGSGGAVEPLSPELVAALEEKPSRPWRDLFRMLGEDGLLAPAVILAALAAAAFGVMVEALLFQGLFDLSRKLGVAEQRIGAMALLASFAAALLLLELPLASNLLRLGRKLETRLRVSFLRKIPRLGDRYFQSRTVSDMAERSHSVQLLRILPTLGGRFIRLIFEIALTAAGIIWLDPKGATAAITVAVIAVALPLAMQVRLTERDLRIRNHNAALSRFYLDALLGLVAVKTHGAERAVRREHESLLVEWMHASFGLLRAAITVEAVEALVGFGLAAWLLLDHLARGGGAGGVLLLVYWALNLPVLGQEIALIAQQYPAQRNVTLRLLEPLAAPEDAEAPATETTGDASTRAVAVEAARAEPVIAKAVRSESQRLVGAERLVVDEIGFAPTKDRRADGPERASGARITFESVSVRAAGHLILDEVDLSVEPSAHIAIVGPSGAGKSSFVGLLLGWHRAATGRVIVDGEVLAGEKLERLRRETAWVDPAIQLWNRTLIENLRYGARADSRLPLGAMIDCADLRRLLEKLPDGLQTTIGEGGALLSGGEGQRVRLGRAMLRPGVRLVILDEPFRGLDRERRRELLARARKLWSDATLLCITHDVGETTGFERVLVVDEGRIVEDGPPVELAARPRSRYRDLLEAEQVVREKLWASDEWRHLELDAGKLFEADRRDYA
ncbi:MAG TPA: ATP-binding cassette domain-containing protein [Blastocatellia bacterium]|nr:ATP-binding cassette domain-containing protein [Blastocatellia bacterium]